MNKIVYYVIALALLVGIGFVALGDKSPAGVLGGSVPTPGVIKLASTTQTSLDFFALTTSTDPAIYDRQIGNSVDDVDVNISYDADDATGQIEVRFYTSYDGTTFYNYTGLISSTSTSPVYGTSTIFTIAPSVTGTTTNQFTLDNVNTLWLRTRVDRAVIGTGKSVSNGNVRINLVPREND